MLYNHLEVQMSRYLIPLAATASILTGAAMADVPRVAVDIAPVHSLVTRVMEGVGTPSLIVQPGASPHEYNLRPSEAQALQDADLVFWIGEDLTPWMENSIETLAGDAAVTTLLDADGTRLLEFREGALFEAHSHGDEEHADEDDHDHEAHSEDGHDDHDHEDHADEEAHEHEEHAGGNDHDHDEHAEADDHDHGHAHGDHDHEAHSEDGHDDHDHEDHADEEAHEHEEHAGGNDHDHDEHAEADDHDHGHAHGAHDPHAWLSPENAASWLNVIAAQLSAADPENAGTYFANAAVAREELSAVSAEVNAILDPVRDGRFIVFHDAYQYFETAFDFPASGAISIGDATDPSPARIAEIQERIADEGIQCVLSEPQFDPGLVATVMEGADANTSVLDPLGSNLETGANLYPQLLRNLANALADCLS